MYSIKLLFLLLLIFAALSCDKKEPEPPEPPQLTPMTTTGAETLSFLKDGEVWIADRDGFSPVSSISQSDKRFSVDSAVRLGPNQQENFILGFVLEDYEPKKYYDFERLFGGILSSC